MQLDQNLAQVQKLMLTQSLSMAIKVLEMNAADLSEFIKDELSENPILDCDSNYDYSAHSDELEKLKKYDDKSIYDFKERNYEDDTNSVTPFNFISEKKTLRDHLKDQLGEMKIDNSMRKLCAYLIEDIDERGYLPSNINGSIEGMSYSSEEIDEAVSIIQSMDPCGVGSRDLKECLCIQLKEKDMYSNEMKIIIEECLEDIAMARYSVIAKKAGISVNSAKQCCAEIKSLEPKPSRGYCTGEEIKYIIPDAEIYKENDTFNIKMTEGIIPKVKINNEYRKLMISEGDSETKQYIDKKSERARNILNGVEKREDTIIMLLKYIVENQQEYFEYGREKLKPMSIKKTAEDLELSESTISRAVKDKFIFTPNGIVSIRSLFTSSINQGSEEISTDIVKNKIKNIIDKEDKVKPFSDQIICRMLNDYSIEISRRTVAKYREELGIESSSRRKKI